MNIEFQSRCKRQKQVLISLVRVITIAFFIPCIVFEAIAQEFEFRFNPPDGIAFVQTSKITKIKDLGPLGKQTDETESKTKVVIKKTPSGYSAIFTPISATMSQDGKKVDNLILSLLQDIVVTYEVDAKGQLKTISGFDTLEKKIKETFPPEAVESLSTVINEQTMINKEKAEWNGRIGSFVGSRVNLGDVWTSTDEFALPKGGTVTFYSTTKVADKVKCGTWDCLQIQFSYNSDAKALKDFIGKVASDIAEAANSPKPKPEISEVEIDGGGERLIDPNTMLIYSETLTRTMKIPMEVPGQGKVMTTMQEKREYTFDYAK